MVTELKGGTRGHESTIAELCDTFGWDRVALLHEDTVWGSGGAAAFQESWLAAHGEELRGGLVSFSLAAFRNGSVHVRDLVSRISTRRRASSS